MWSFCFSMGENTLLCFNLFFARLTLWGAGGDFSQYIWTICLQINNLKITETPPQMQGSKVAQPQSLVPKLLYCLLHCIIIYLLFISNVFICLP